MDFKKLAPWNWFKKEEEETSAALPVQHTGQAQPQKRLSGPIGELHQEVDNLFNNFFRGFRMSPFRTGSVFNNSLTAGLLKPSLDIGASDTEYAISIEVPGVEQKDIQLEVSKNILTVRGEKKQEKEEKKKDYYRMERTYGSFQRVLSLPEDADQENIKASYKNGVLTIAMPKKPLLRAEVKQIEIK